MFSQEAAALLVNFHSSTQFKPRVGKLVVAFFFFCFSPLLPSLQKANKTGTTDTSRPLEKRAHRAPMNQLLMARVEKKA